ncbi:hypothetical protein Q4F19_08420 [Sphingomonas sp. BIUV-7]|uniref:Uncharacterized protein n=1 Tax=Sphingomonas natans TaxID=3063330 RepID=A0ABT8Y984_9SPHN|nr:hypothetical protein [Sphingomonas sp. BIUV-7]MDO6414403.1 hypothetical protein [Sphingomonas sp. BIUV-7]
MAFGLFRSGGYTVESTAADIGHYFRTRVEPDDLQSTFTRMLECEHIALHPKKPSHYVMTRAGQATFERVFFGFMRLVDGGQNRFSLAALWQLATANLDAIVDPITKDFIVDPDKLFGPKKETE